MMRDTEFYEERIAQERAAAANAANETAKRAHDELADLYAERLKAMSARDERERPTLTVVYDNASQRA